MQLGDPSVLLETSNGEPMMATSEAAVAFDGGAEIEMMDSIVGMDATNNNNSGDDIVDLKRSGGGGGNRWPRQETFALLKIRSDMDAVFRDSSLKGPLWEQVSRYVFLYIYVCVCVYL